MTDEKVTEMKNAAPGKDLAARPVADPLCPGCEAKKLKPPTLDVAVKVFPTPAGSYMAIHFCKWCGYVYACQLVPGELLGQGSRIAGVNGPLDFNPSRRG
jgi:hypothetical protein